MGKLCSNALKEQPRQALPIDHRNARWGNPPDQSKSNNIQISPQPIPLKASFPQNKINIKIHNKQPLILQIRASLNLLPGEPSTGCTPYVKRIPGGHGRLDEPCEDDNKDQKINNSSSRESWRWIDWRQQWITGDQTGRSGGRRGEGGGSEAGDRGGSEGGGHFVGIGISADLGVGRCSWFVEGRGKGIGILLGVLCG